ncbi:PAS domain S-box protein [Nodosilinea sp. E11]|uniref:PAS domain S-box protein n=1 Tax=Nodosilinea sp. E11 TaxID=3037479 RepID=UPI0029350CDC|nr:PAS domain S-box protein [Nodosilinea sp. E11]WOD40279.1 PAS domain S-box protein [Nodosilinea sp. E11]
MVTSTPMLPSLSASGVQGTGSALTDAILPNPVIFGPEAPLMEVIAGIGQAQHSACSIADGSGQITAATAESCAIVMAEGQVVGICTERDLVRLAAQGRSAQGLTVADVMTTPVITWGLEQLTDVFPTLQFMQRHHIRHLPIVDRQGGDPQGKLLGVVTPQSLRQLLKLLDLLRLRQIEEVMQPQVVQAQPTTSVLEIARQMANGRVSCVVIVAPHPAGGAPQPIGIVTERDIVQFQCLGLNLATLSAATVMSAPLCCLYPQDSLWMAHQLMQEKRIRRLVITDREGHLTGLITQTSMLNIFSAGEIYETLEILQERVHQLEAEKLELLHSRNQTLEQQVVERTAELKKRADREEFLASFARQISQALDLSPILTSSVQEVKRFLECDRVVIYKFDNERQGTVTAEAVDPPWRPTLGSHCRDVCFLQWVETDSLGHRQQIVDDIYQANLSPDHLAVLESLQIKGYLIVPIVINNQLWGLLEAHQCAAAKAWEYHNLDLLDRLSTQLAIAIQQSQLYQQAQAEIQERRQAEQELKQERNFASAILHAAGALVVVSDHQGQIVQFNHTCQQLTGYCLAEVQGRRVSEFLVAPEDRDPIQNLIDDVLSNRSRGVSEHYWLTKTGDRRLIAWTHSTLLDDQGQVDYIIGTGIDITETRQAEAALRKSEDTNRALLDTIPDLMIRIKGDGTYLDFLPSYGFKVIQPFTTMVGRSIYQALPESLAQERMGYIQQALATGQTQVYEYEYEDETDGKTLYEEARIAVSGPNEVLCIVRDISERKRLEYAEKQATAALQSLVEGTASVTGEHFFEALVEHLATALNVRHALVTTCDRDQGQTLALYSQNQLRPNISFDLTHLPCKLTLQQQVYCCSSHLSDHFANEQIAFLGAESYCGVALLNTQGQPIGTLCILDDKPIDNMPHVEGILRIFAARAAAELERQQSIDALYQLNQDLEARVEARTSELSASNTALLASNAALLRSQEQLRHSEELLRLTIDSAPIGITTTDLTGKFLTVNQALCTMLGYTPAELTAQAFNSLTHPDDRAASQQAMEQLAAGKIQTFELEKRYLHKDGTTIDAIVRVSTVRDREAQPLHFVAEIEDITIRKRAEAERTRLLSILEASLNEIYIFDADTLRFSYVNYGALDNLGYSLEHMQQMTLFDIEPQLSETEFAALSAPLRRHETEKLSFEMVHQRADGSCYPVDVHLQLIEREAEKIFLAVISDVTYRKQAEEQISRQLLAIETAIDGIAVLREGQYQYLNQAHVGLFGYDSVEELLGQSWQILYSEAEINRFAAEVFPALAAQGHWRGEAVATRKDGTTFYEDVSLTLSANGDLICVCRDINARKLAEVALRESKELLQDFFDNASDLIQSISMADGRLLFVNQAWLNTLGYTQAEIEGYTIFDVLSPSCIPHYQQLFQTLLQGDCTAIDPVEMALMTKTGEEILLQGSVNVRIENGVRVATRGIFRNVTERQRAEQSMQQQLAAIEAASDGIAILDSQGSYIFVNTAHCRLFGLEPGDLLGQSWHCLYSDAEINRFEQAVFPYLAEHHHWRGEAIASRRDGSTFPQEVSLTQIDGVGLVCVCQDISDKAQLETERKQAEAEMRRALETERELNDLKSRFVSMTSHEFRTPLGVIASSAGILQDYGDRLDTAKQHKHLARIQDSVVHMTQLLEDVLMLSRVEAGKLQLKLVPVAIDDFCQDLIDDLNLSDGNSRIGLEVDLAGSRLLMFDQRLLRQILTNLLSNALKYSYPDSEVDLRIAYQGDRITIEIQDRGIGIPPEDLKHLFQSFHRARNVGNIPGTGLGLSIVKKLVELHQGDIICHSSVDVGTTFTLGFPRWLLESSTLSQ